MAVQRGADAFQALHLVGKAVSAFVIASMLLACAASDDSKPPYSTADDAATCAAAAGERCDCDDEKACDSVPEPKPEPTDAAAPRERDGGSKDATADRRDSGVAGDGGTPAGEQAPEAGPAVVIAEPSDEASHIYDQDLLHTFDVEVAPEDLQRVDMNPSAEQYVPARLTFEGKTYDVGYRYKGSLGAFFPPCANLLTRQKEGKCSVKLSFNWQDPEGKFFGLKKLLFHAMNNDRSMMRERLGYTLFRQMGVPASRASHAVLRVNGKAQIYALVEEIDGRFARSRFSEGGKGNLYKEVWPVAKEAQPYLNALETNEDDQPSVDGMIRFQEAVRQGPEAMAALMDVDVTTSYIAVDRVILSDDGPFHLYCYPMGNNPTAPANHNYYWYEAKAADRMWLIPWDLDYSMAEIENPAHMPFDWKKPADPADCSCGGGLGRRELAPGCDPVIKNFQAWIAAYEAKVDALIAGPFRKTNVDEALDRWKKQLTTAGYAPPEAEITRLTQILDRARMNRGFKY
jgi:spore coat protein H